MNYNIRQIMKKVRQTDTFRQNIPMEAISGWPAIKKRDDRHYLIIPYYMAKKKEKGKTRIYLPRYIITVDCDTENIQEFCNTIDQGFVTLEQQNESIGEFPYQAIANMTVLAYKEKRERLLDLYQVILNTMVKGEPICSEIENEFKALLELMVEPYMKEFYHWMAPKFFGYFMS